MLDLAPIHTGQMSTREFVAREKISCDDLAPLTNEMIDHMLAQIADCADADVTFMPKAPDADDTFAQTGDARSGYKASWQNVMTIQQCRFKTLSRKRARRVLRGDNDS